MGGFYNGLDRRHRRRRLCRRLRQLLRDHLGTLNSSIRRWAVRGPTGATLADESSGFQRGHSGKSG